MPHEILESSPSRQQRDKPPGKHAVPAMLYRLTLTLARCPEYPGRQRGNGLRDGRTTRT